jgi:predicted dehydrogenase
MKDNRRDFIKKTAAAGLGLGLAAMPTFSFGAAEKDDKIVGVGLIGVGLRGRNHLDLLLRRDDCAVKAICDIDPAATSIALDMFQKAGKAKPETYGKDNFDYLNLLKREDIQAVIISTPWEWHTKMAVATMKHGKYAGIEVSAANTLEECWDLVNTYEETGMPCMILENVCYRRDVMAVLNMVRQNMFGELIHMECGYQHDLREVKFNNGKQAYGGGVEFGEKGFSEAKWRTNHSIYRNGDLYPTHGIGPIATYLNIDRGNRFVSLVSMASKSRGLHNYIVDKGGENHPNAKVRWKLGDVVTTQIKTALGETIIVTHDTNLPRPYSLGFRVQGEKGIWMDLNKSIYLEGTSPQAHRWEDTASYFEKYDHPLWKKYEQRAIGAGHGGMDFFVIHAFIEAVKRKAPTPLDAYDAASWSAISPLSEISIEKGSSAVEFPDFTRGQWINRKPTFALNDEY